MAKSSLMKKACTTVMPGKPIKKGKPAKKKK